MKRGDLYKLKSNTIANLFNEEGFQTSWITNVQNRFTNEFEFDRYRLIFMEHETFGKVPMGKFLVLPLGQVAYLRMDQVREAW